ncbi:hypothetical protein FACS189411_08030 [Bacteroidia bacterium]|nr:hypothetical protein FACS189411_08030 [Bacteroidia bacterium]
MKSTQKEFLKMLSAYQGIIHKVNQIYFKSKADKEDNFQEIVYQLWRSFLLLQNKEKPASWIYAVAINTSISKIRKDSRLEFYYSVPDVEIVNPYEQQERNENYQRLINALYELNEIDRSIMLLYMEDYSYEEIAEIVGMSSSNIGVKVHRLKNKMWKYTNGKSVKEWLEYRIKKIEKNIKFNAKYDWVIYTCSILFAIGFYALYQIVANTTPGILTVILIPLGLIIYLLIIRRSLNRNYQKALRELKKLYEQFEESNE